MKRLMRPILFLFSLLTIFTFAQTYDKNKAQKLFLDHCSKCHRKDGRGIKGVYPPLKNSDYIKKADKIELLRGMLFGRSGRIIVNGNIYYGVMVTEVDKSLSDSDIAMILEFIYREMNNMSIPVVVNDVVKARKLGKLPEHK